MKNKVYLGDIDPNNSILPAMDIRRMIMFQLLIWDSIVLSDSQLLTDPRINTLMGNYNGDEAQTKYGVLDVDSSYKGIEALIENGLIEIAFRKDGNPGNSLVDTWETMRRSEKKVPYLPEDEKYVHYLNSLKCNTHTFETASLSAMFQQNLTCGISTDPLNGGMLLQNNKVETELKHMFNEKSPLFRDILDFLRQQKKCGNLSPTRYMELYDYVYSCYNVNISRALGCNINTKFAHIPFHLQAGEEYWGHNALPEQIDRLRPTWALNPIFLDCLTFEEFVEVRRHLKTHKVREFYLNAVKSPWPEIEDAWDDYVDKLELCIKRIMLEKQNDLHRRMFMEFGNEKFLTKPRQYTTTTPLFEIAKCVLSLVPGISEIVGVTDTTKNIVGAIVAFSRRKEMTKLSEEYKSVSELASKETRVVTRYDEPISK